MIYSQKKTFLFTTVLVIGTVATILIHYFIRNQIYQDYLQIDIFFFTFIPLIVTTTFYIIFDHLPDLIIDENYIQVFEKSNIQKFSKAEISEISCFVVKHKNGKTKYINITTNDNQQFEIGDDDYKNFNELEMFLRIHYNLQDTASKKIFNYKILALIVLFFTVFISMAIIEPEQNGIKKVQVVLVAIPKINYGGSKSSTDKIEFKFNNLEKFSTKLTTYKSNRDYVEMSVNNMFEGDTFTIEIPKNFYEKKIAKTQPLSFIDKHFKYTNIPVYAVYRRNSEVPLFTTYP